MKNIKILFLILIIPFVLTGCWDSVEINERAFVMGIGLDKAQTPNKLNVTYEIALPSKISKGGEGGGGGEKGDGAVWNITKNVGMPSRANYAVFDNIDKVVYLEHAQLIVIGSELAKRGITDEIDYYFRNPQIRRKAKVVCFDGPVREFFNYKPKTTKSPSRFISEIINTNEKYSHTVGVTMDLNKLAQDIRNDFDFTMLKLKKLNDEVKIDGAVAYKNGKYKETIESQQVQVLKWTYGKVRRGTLRVSDPRNPSKKIIFDINNGSSEIKPVFDNNKVNFEMKLDIEGDISEHEDTNFLGLFDQSYINTVEKKVQEKMRSRILNVYNKYIKEERIDVLQLQRKIKNHNIKFYKQNKARLADVLAKSDFKVDVTAKIRRLGLNK